MSGVKTADFFTEATETLDVDEVAELTELVEMQLKAEVAVELADKKLKAEKKKLLKIEEQLLPDAMTAAGVVELKLVSGQKITVSEFVRCHIKKENQPRAYQYLRDIGSGDLIKNIVSVNFKSGDDNKACSLMENLEDLGFFAEKKESVHIGTLQAWAKEQLREGKPLDKDILGVYVGSKAKIK